jgi:hypothetical protein
MSTSVEMSTNTGTGYALGKYNSIGTPPADATGTFCFFWNPISFANSFTIIEWAGSGAPSYQGVAKIYIDRGFGNQLTYESYTSAGGTNAQHTTLIPVVNTWYFLAFSINPAAASVNFYYKQVGAPACTLWQGIATDGGVITGAMSIGNDDALSGANQARFAGLKWWSKKFLSAGEIENESKQLGIATSKANLFAYWSLDTNNNVWSTQPVGGPLKLGTSGLGTFANVSQKSGPLLPIIINKPVI